jgi:excisionase family DNA binding protein
VTDTHHESTGAVESIAGASSTLNRAPENARSALSTERHASTKAALESPSEAPDALWDVKQLARFLRVSTSWVYQAAAQGVVPVTRVGSLLRFEAAAIRAWMRGETAGQVRIVNLPGLR